MVISIQIETIYKESNNVWTRICLHKNLTKRYWESSIRVYEKIGSDRNTLWNPFTEVIRYRVMEVNIVSCMKKEGVPKNNPNSPKYTCFLWLYKRGKTLHLWLRISQSRWTCPSVSIVLLSVRGVKFGVDFKYERVLYWDY